MAYSTGHTSSTTREKCVICGDYASTYLSINNYNKSGYTKKGTEIEVPACDGDCWNEAVKKKDILISYAKSINELFKK